MNSRHTVLLFLSLALELLGLGLVGYYGGWGVALGLVVWGGAQTCYRQTPLFWAPLRGHDVGTMQFVGLLIMAAALTAIAFAFYHGPGMGP